MGQVKSRRKRNKECSIEMLTDDALLKIFSYLTLYDKGQSSKTCKRWNILLKDPYLWRIIDFWNEGPSKEIPTEDAANVDTWKFPTNANLALGVLKTYSNSSLKRVYLRVSNLEIMRYLAINCPNLQTLSVLSPIQNIPYCENDIIEYFEEANFVLPNKLEKLQLSFCALELTPSEGAGQSQITMLAMMQFKQTVMKTLTQCQNLRHLTLKMCNGLSEDDVETLTFGIPNLQELWLLTFTSFPDTTTTLQGILRRIVHNLKGLTSLRFMPVNRSFSGYSDYPPSYSIDDLLQDLSHRKNMRELRVRDAMFSPEAFTVMTRALGGLEELVLWNCNCVTDDIMSIIARDLPSLTTLELPFSRPYTDRGLKALKNHPSLRNLNVFRSMLDVSFEVLSSEAIFETLMTLPYLEEVGGLHWQSRDAEFSSYLERLRVQKPNIRVELS